MNKNIFQISNQITIEEIKKIYDLKTHLHDLDEELNGNKSKSEIGEKNKPTVSYHMRVATRGLSTTYGPTGLHKEQLSVA